MLLILAGVTITLVFSDGGILNQADRAKEQTEIAALREKIDNVRISWITDKVLDPSLPIDNLWDRLIGADIIATKDDVEGPEQEGENNIYILDTTEGYAVEIIVTSDGTVLIGDIGKGDSLPPQIRKIETTATKTSFTAKAIVSRLDGGTIEYYYKLSTQPDTSYVKIENASIENGVTVSEGLIEEATYNIKVIAQKGDKKVEAITNVVIRDRILVTGITLNKTEIITSLNDSITLIAEIAPENADNKELDWESDNPAVVTVDNNGVIVGKSIGTANIIVKAKDGSNISTSCKVTVKELSGLASLIGKPAIDINQTIEDDYKNKVVIPAGFTVVPSGGNDEASKVEYNYVGDGYSPAVQDGVVIEDSTGNQFVWIPVGTINNKDGTTNTITLGRYESFKADANGNYTPAQTIENYQIEVSLTSDPGGYDVRELENQSGVIGAKDLKKFLENTLTNGGYYLARYEVSNQDGKVISKANKVPWDNIHQNSAANEAKGMYSNNPYYESDLINGYSWDTALIFLQTYSKNNKYATEATSISTIVNTGTLGDKACNIYDMAYNCSEWCTEYGIGRKNGAKISIRRGEGYATRYASSRGLGSEPPGGATKGVSFRTLIMIK